METIALLLKRNLACNNAILSTLQEMLSIDKSHRNQDLDNTKQRKFFDLLPRFPVQDVETLKKLDNSMDPNKNPELYAAVTEQFVSITL